MEDQTPIMGTAITPESIDAVKKALVEIMGARADQETIRTAIIAFQGIFEPVFLSPNQEGRGDTFIENFFADTPASETDIGDEG